jgi:hypothetical protein
LNLSVDKVTHHWSKLQSGMSNCSDYFENVLLAEMSHPLVLGLDKVDWIFEHENIAKDFFKLVRSWHEQSKHQKVWQKMVLVLVHTENVPLSFYYSSPFNIATSIELPVFNATQVQDLVQRYKLNWKMPEIEQLMAMLGGHPHLVRLALYEIAHKRTTLDQLLDIAPTEEGLFGGHLQRLLMDLQTDNKEVDLVTTMRQVVSTNVPIEIDSSASRKLCSMGLVNKVPNNTVEPLCGLYRQYFQKRL